jgi:PucR C-terminal helix-turn-helix domain/GGDEF-like domain
VSHGDHVDAAIAPKWSRRRALAGRAVPKMTFVDPGAHAGDELLAAVAASLSGRLAEISQDVTRHLATAIEQLQGDAGILGVLRASVTENIAAVFHVFEHGMPVENIEAPPAATEYARRLAQRGVPGGALIRAYRVGHERFLQWCLDELARQGQDVPLVVAATRRMVELSSGYIDRVTEQVLTTYEHERERWLLTQTAMRAGRVRALLEDMPVNLDTIEAELGYRLRQHHVGLIAWDPDPAPGSAGLARLERLVIAAAQALACPGRPLLVPRDEASTWAWLPAGSRTTLRWELLHKAVDDTDPSTRLAAGSPASGVEGFRRTHHQAHLAQELALTAGPASPRTTVFAQIGPVALLCADLNTTRAWVHTTLGALAIDDEPRARLRETARVFLSTGGSYTATADQLMLHKNTVHYRIRKAEEIRGRSWQEDRLDVELALSACRWLGPAVLQPPPAGR